MIWKKQFPSRPNLTQSKLQLLHHKIKLFLNQLRKPMYNLMIQQLRKKLKQNQELPKRDSMHILSMKRQMRMIKLFHLLTNLIQDGKLMYVSFKHIIVIMVNIVMVKKHNNWPKLNQNQKKIKKQKNLDQNLVKSLQMHQRRLNHGIINIHQLKKFLII